MIANNMLKSDFLIQFLSKDLLTILIALLGLNVAVLTILIAKLSESKAKYNNLDITDILSEMKFSLLELFVKIVLAVVLSIILTSEIILFDHKALICSSILLATLIYSLSIIWDTANSIFILIKEEEGV